MKTESVDYSMHSYDDIAVPESNDHNAFKKVIVVVLWSPSCVISVIIIIVFVMTHSSSETG